MSRLQKVSSSSQECLQSKQEQNEKKVWHYLKYKYIHISISIYLYLQGDLQKCRYFYLAITFTKIRKPLIFFLQLLEVYGTHLVETTLESMMFYYTFSAINTMFVPCTALLYDSTAGTQTLKLSTTPLSISCGINLISLLMKSSLVCGSFLQTFSLRYPLRK